MVPSLAVLEDAGLADRERRVFLLHGVERDGPGGLRGLGPDAHHCDGVAVVQHGVGRRRHVVVADQLHVVRLQQLVDRARRRVERDLLVVDGERPGDARAVDDAWHRRRDDRGRCAPRSSLFSLSCAASLSALVSTVRTVRTFPSMSTVTGNARSTSTWMPSWSALLDDGTTTSPRGEAHVRGGEQGADRVGVGVDLLAGAVDHEGDVGARRGGGLLDDPGAAQGGEHHHHGHPEDPGGGEEAVAPAAAGHGAGRRALLEEVGDRRELLQGGQGEPGGGVVGLGPGRRRRRAGLDRRQVVGRHRLGLGDDRGRVLGVGVEQRVHRAGGRRRRAAGATTQPRRAVRPAPATARPRPRWR